MAVVNGQMSSGVLVSVGGGQALRGDAAVAWLAVVAEVRAQFGIVLRLTDSYRPYAVQVRIFNERYDPASSGSGPFGDVRWWAGVRYVRMRGASAARPGTSNHGLGVAVDVTGLGGFSGSAYAHLAVVAPAHGWSNKAGRQINEAWHWEYTATADTHTSSPLTPLPPSEDDVLNDADKQWIQNLVVGALRAPEFDLRADDRAWDTISQWYVDLLGRPGTPADIAPRVAAIIAGGSYAGGYAAIYGAPEAQAHRAAKPAASSGAVVDVPALAAAVAKAVNDDAARRLAS